MEPYVPMENADDPGGLRLPGDAAEVPGVGVEGADAEVEEPEELEEDDPHVPGRQERLKVEASSVLHKLTHLPKNPFCDSCQRGKMKESTPGVGLSSEMWKNGWSKSPLITFTPVPSVP